VLQTKDLPVIPDPHPIKRDAFSWGQYVVRQGQLPVPVDPVLVPGQLPDFSSIQPAVSNSPADTPVAVCLPAAHSAGQGRLTGNESDNCQNG